MRKRLGNVFSLSMLVFIDMLSVGLVLPLLATIFSHSQDFFILKNTNQYVIWYSLIVSIPIGMILFGAPILGALSDKLGRKKVILLSLVGISISTILSILSLEINNLLLFFFSRVLIGLFDSNQAIAQAAITDISKTEQERIQNMTIVTLMATLGLIIGPVLGGVLADSSLISWFNIKTPFWVSLILALLNLIWLASVFSETKIINTQKNLNSNQRNVFYLLSNKKLLSLFFGLLVLQFCWAVVYQMSNLYLAKNYGYSPANLGYFGAFISLIFAVFMLITSNFLLKIISIKALLNLGYIIFFLGVLSLVTLFKFELGYWFSLILIAIGMGSTYNIFISLVSAQVPNEAQGKMMGFATAIVAVAWLLAAIYIGLISIFDSSYLFMGVALISLLGLLTIFLHNPAKRVTSI